MKARSMAAKIASNMGKAVTAWELKWGRPDTRAQNNLIVRVCVQYNVRSTKWIFFLSSTRVADQLLFAASFKNLPRTQPITSAPDP